MHQRACTHGVTGHQSQGSLVRKKQLTNKKAFRKTQTLRAGCSKAEPKIFALLQTPSRGRRTAKI